MHAGRVDLGGGHIARLEIANATSLADLPHDLATAILVDNSRSMTSGERDAQRRLVLAYARAAGDTQIQVIAYARTARALLPAWASARVARLERALRQLAPRNGSNLDAAFDEAARWLALHAGTRRVVVITDAQVSTRVAATLDTLAGRLPARTLVHVVTIEDSVLARADGFGRALAESTGGIAAAGGAAPIDATLLVRPLQIDGLAITAPGWQQFDATRPGTCARELAAGASCTWWGEGTTVSGPLAITGELWSTRFTRLVTPDLSRATELARELVPMRTLDDRATVRAEALARAANDRWSFYAEWGSPGGYDTGVRMMHTRGATCCGFAQVIDRATVRASTGTPLPLPLFELAPQFAHVAARCATTADVTIELTGHEIVDVTVTPPNRCVEDAVWDVALAIPPRVRVNPTFSIH